MWGPGLATRAGRVQGMGEWDQAQEELTQAHLTSIHVHQRKAVTFSRHQDPETLFSLRVKRRRNRGWHSLPR